ncbi:uncharacterized protein VNE69_03039 [Vairimorpha necatrix]|uniref:Uncharacterized protein n=1 Tax=Vairimorpha necatrix TaxID=6039 RepID=A0AAX4JAE1_9MICR
MSDWTNFDNTKQVNEWTNDEQSDLYKNIDYKNEWLDENNKTEEEEEKNELYEKMGLKYESMFDGPKLFHREQTRKRRNM